MVTLPSTGVQYDRASLQDLGGLVSGDPASKGGGNEVAGLHRDLTRLNFATGRDPCRQAAVEDHGPSVPGGSKQPPGTGSRTTSTIVGDHPAHLGDAGGLHRLGETLRRRQGVPAGGAGWASQLLVQVDKASSRDVRGQECIAICAVGKSPAHVEDGEIGIAEVLH